MPALDDIIFGLNLGSLHLDQNLNRMKQYNDVNPGFYARKGDWQGGLYHNSYNKPSAYLMRLKELGHGFSAGLGGVTGYKYPITPMPVLSYKLNDLLRLTAVPSVDRGALGALHLSAEF
jgi:hypothetical protein